MTTTHPHSRSPGDALTPHARGLRGGDQAHGQGPGIIPACAGFTVLTPGTQPAPADHPRVRGVYVSADVALRDAVGSSPRARGLPRGVMRELPPLRIIPACAGFTRLYHLRKSGSKDHPRMRGVYADAALMALVAWGSSPHARGLPVLPKLNPEGNRIIPACAGFTAGVPGSGRGRPDHPRMRGVYPGYTPGRDVYHGSSPHARGLRRHTMCRSHLLGIIPACAGFTAPAADSPHNQDPPDHPRMRGVYTMLRA